MKLSLQPTGLPRDAIITPATVDLQLHVARQPLWRKALWWLAVLLLPLVLLLAAYSIVKGEMPWAIWSTWRERAYLEGELEFIQPRPSPDGETHVSLAGLRQERMAISTVVPAATEADGELFTEFKGGVKHVRFRRTRGSTRVNGVEVSVADVYDGYLIDAGNVRVRFHWLGHEEPSPGPEDQ
jgi:hypothetical protein